MPHNNELPWSLIDGIQIHEDADGHLFTFFDLLASARTEAIIDAVRSKADEAIDSLRALFIIEAELREIDSPKTWDQLDELFQLWATERIRESMARATPEAKELYARLGEFQNGDE